MSKKIGPRADTGAPSMALVRNTGTTKWSWEVPQNTSKNESRSKTLSLGACGGLRNNNDFSLKKLVMGYLSTDTHTSTN
jgi:hypothetical protein